MKRIAICITFICWCILLNAQKEVSVIDSFYLLSPVEVKAIRAGDNAPFTKSNINKKEIEKANLGQDIPFILNQTPSVVVNSDAGNGVGYTGIRIRGTDATRINITMNGIPYNDAESQGTFFVDLPDFLSSVSSIQIQRGVGTSSNGAGAFGASINFSTNEVNKKAYVEFNNSYGSFNTRKNTIKIGSGLIGKHFTTDLRVSDISSDGFIDRAFSKLKSLHFSTAYINKGTTVRLNMFLGKEKTYQAWYGISEADLKAGRRTINYAGTERTGSPYDNETDNYQQNHYQLFFDQIINKKISFNTALYASDGKGYYEEYKADQLYADYNLADPVHSGIAVTNSDMVRRLWLDNHLLGTIFSFQNKNKKTEATLGGGYSSYHGLHYGNVIWAEEGLSAIKNWYDLGATKSDFNIFLKQQIILPQHFILFYDLQYRYVNYAINGFENNPLLFIKNRFHFFNPKIGVQYSKNGWKSYLSFSVANKEPNRDDFEASETQQPKPERLYDTELSIEKSNKKYNWSATLYYMNYKDQLVLTGKINNVGAYTRTNIPKSYRAGIELQGHYKFNSWFNVSANLAFSRNKINNFTEYIDDYDNGGQKINYYRSTDIALSPGIVGSATISFFPIKKWEISLLSKYVSKQFLDNTQNNSRVLNAFFVQDIKAAYTIYSKCLKEINISAQVNNVFNNKYEPNGYTYNYITGGIVVVNNYYFPMAGTNFMVGLNVKL